MKGNSKRGSNLTFGDYGLMALEPVWLTDRQIEAARIAISRHVKRVGKMWIKVFPDKPYTKKPAETFSWGPEQRLSKVATLRLKEIVGIDA